MRKAWKRVYGSLLALVVLAGAALGNGIAVTWDGSGDMTWTQPDATSWSGATYGTNDFAIFAGAGQGTVTLSGTITPGSVTVSTGAYTFAGTAIGGSGGLTLSGATTVTLNNAHTYASNTVVGAGSKLSLTGNNLLPYGAGKSNVVVNGTLSLDGSNTRAHAFNGLSGSGSVLLTGYSWESGTLTLGYGDASAVFDGAISDTGAYLSLIKTGTGTIVLNGRVVYRGGTTVNSGILALNGSNTLSGNVAVNTGGTLRLGHPQAVSGAPLVTVAGGATLDTTNMTASYPLTQTLRVGGRGVTTTLATAAGNGLTLRPPGALQINAYDGVTTPLSVSGGGALTLATNSVVTVTVAGTTPLAVGDYLLVDGGVAGETPTAYVTVNGAGRVAATTATLVITDGDLILRIANYSGHALTNIVTIAAGPWDWPATWQGGIVPGPGDSVAVNHAVTLLCGTPTLASFSNNATLTFNGWNALLAAENVTINATVTHLAQTATAIDPFSGVWVPDNRVWIVCTNLTLNASKMIDVGGMGYNGVSGPGRSSVNYSGGSYGGAGESSSGMTYGSTVAPVDPGSGGRGTSVTDPGGAGGGVVRIEASGAVTLYGTISARGSPPPAVVGCGSGGSIYITCKTLAGGGVVSVNGGSSANTYCGGGGGGRIAVIYDPAAQGALPPPEITLDANGGRGGDIGTLYFPDNCLLTSPMRHSGQWLAPNATNWTCGGQLLFTNANLRFPNPGFTLSVAGDWTMIGANSASDCRPYGLALTNAQITCGGSVTMSGCTLILRTDGTTASPLTVGGDLTLSNSPYAGSKLHLYAAMTNGTAREYGLLVNVSKTVYVSSNSTNRWA